MTTNHGHVRATEKVIAVNEDEELRKRGFNLGATLGEGSYAKVKCAFWNQINRRVAIKIINKKKAPKDFQTRFLPRELDLMKKIKHQYIIEMFEILHFNGKVYLILEMAGHGDLLEYIKLRGAIPEDKAKNMFVQLVQAIRYLHHRDIVHRDLKCENVLLDVKNQVKLSDFGFARHLGNNELSNTFCGSAAYAAPEILQGIPYTGKSYDIWSLGVILYIMVGGSMPYDDSNIKKMIRYQTERKVGFSKTRPLSSEVKYLIHHMLEAKVMERFCIDQVLRSMWLEPVCPPRSPEPIQQSELTITLKGRALGQHEEPMDVEPTLQRDSHHQEKRHEKSDHHGKHRRSSVTKHRGDSCNKRSSDHRDKQSMGPSERSTDPGAQPPRPPPTPHSGTRHKHPCTAHGSSRSRHQHCVCSNCQRAAGTGSAAVGQQESDVEHSESPPPRAPPTPLSNMVHHHHEHRDRVWRTDIDN